MEMLTLEQKIDAFLTVDPASVNHYGYGNNDNSDGSGSGCGSGYDHCSVTVYGFGCGCGYGFGCGHGDVCCDGHGGCFTANNNVESFDGHKVYIIDNVPTCIEQVYGNYAVGFTFTFFVKKKCFIAKVDNCFAHGDTLHKSVEEATKKALQHKPLEEHIADIVKKQPDKNALVPNTELFSLHHVLTGSCEFGRRLFCEQRGISLDDSMTIADFVKLTKDEYGKYAIRQLAKAYGIKT